MIGKSAASWQQVGNGAAEAAGDEKRASGGQKRAFRTLFLLRRQFLSALFLRCFYFFLAFFSLFSLFVARKGGRKGGEGEKRG
ncbi:hypothetical protein D7V78_10570 [Parabacteroides distasonis]|uniref:Uncharacterized protein n=1 Tax=Parabacteroides distasonis TaxID=823 RepID=A0A3L7ZQX9_PARDI|nr:hypothetical protein [Parabacteroides distasonis]RLT73332.1 hypothetical protein D7V78_10570 [Parabacteroides distasonis]